MKGHKQVPMKGGDEVDAFCARRWFHWNAGTIKLIKRRFNKRVRLAGKAQAQEHTYG